MAIATATHAPDKLDGLFADRMEREVAQIEPGEKYWGVNETPDEDG